jgi:hypothetical protein
MANTQKPEDGIVIQISYDYQSAGIKKAVDDINNLADNSGKGIVKYQKMAKGIGNIYKELLKEVNLSNEKIYNSSKKAEEQIRKITTSYNNYQNAANRYKKAKKGGDAEKIAVQGRMKQNAYISYTAQIGKAVDSVYRLANAQAKLEETTSKANQKLKEQEEAKAQKRSRAIQMEITKSLNDYLDAQRKQLDNEEKLRQEQKQAKLDFIKDKINKIKNAINKIDLQRLVAQIYLLRRAWKTLLQFTEASASWVENLNLLEVVFGDLNEQAKEFVDNASKNFGLDANALAQYVSTFKQMANAMGQATETGTQMAEALTYLALDISSLRNVDLKTAASDLASGIAGQVKPVRKYGFDITKTSVDELLKEIGGGSSSTITQANKQLARTILLIRQSTDAWGDMAKTINTFANQQRVLNDQFETFKRLLGSALVGTFTLGDTFEEASKTAGIMTKALWTINGALIAINDIIATVIPQAETVNGGIAAGADEAIDSYEELDEAINGSLTSFDKFNTMTSGGNENDITDLLTQAFNKEYAEYMEKFQSAMKNINMYSREIADNMLGILFPNFKEWKKNNPDSLFADWAKTTDEVKTKIGDLKNVVVGLVEAIVSIKSPLSAIMLAVAKSAVTNPTTFNTIVELGKSMTDTVTKLLPIIAKLFDFLAPIAIKLAEISVKILDFLSESGLLIPVLLKLAAAIVTIKGLKFAAEVRKWLEVFPEVGVMLKEIITLLKTKMVAAASAASASLKAFSLRFVEFASSGMGVITAIGTLGLGIGLFTSNLDKMSQKAKTVIPIIASLSAVIAGLAIGIAAASAGPLAALKAGLTAAAIAAGVTLTAGTIIAMAAQKHADGGFQKGGLFYAGEKGAEWVGRQGNTSTIVNDTQMSDIMTDSVALGVIKGNMAVRGSSQKQRPIVLNVNGKKFLEIVEEEASKNGKQLARVK